MIFKFLPYNLLFLFSLFSSILIIFNSNNWFLIWIRLEINLISFIPIILSTSNQLEVEGSIKYFLIQAIASSILFITLIILFSPETTFFPYKLLHLILIISLLIKIGAAPCHFWFPQVINSINWLGCFILSTVQKISPLFLLFYILSYWNLLLIILLTIINSWVGGIGGINQSQIRPLLAYSSISHISWMIAIRSCSFFFGAIYFLMYILISRSLIFILIKIKKLSVNQFNILINLPLLSQIILFLNLLSLAGLPPLLGFLPKWIVINKIIITSPILVITLIFGSLFNLFYYLSIFFSSILNTLKSYELVTWNFFSSIIWIITISPLFLILITLYAMIILY